MRIQLAFADIKPTGISFGHPEAEKLEEQHHNVQYAHTSFLLACAGCSLNYGD
jgi:hypothetical protein